MWSSKLPCEKFILKTSAPSERIDLIISALDELGPSVATILVNLFTIRFPHILVSVYEAVGRRIMACYPFIPGELGKYCPGKLFAQLDPPLVETVNIPDYALGKDLV